MNFESKWTTVLFWKGAKNRQWNIEKTFVRNKLANALKMFFVINSAICQLSFNPFSSKEASFLWIIYFRYNSLWSRTCLAMPFPANGSNFRFFALFLKSWPFHVIDRNSHQKGAKISNHIVWLTEEQRNDSGGYHAIITYWVKIFTNRRLKKTIKKSRKLENSSLVDNKLISSIIKYLLKEMMFFVQARRNEKHPFLL